ncbi:MAG: hypothetical protein HQK71_11740 [Desulfamplus sp.]|nr:hypothetical protein [Desulfamplus sp.]MBF0390761.1 hypothetical protein [Desulfamplus sp.]
MLNSDYSKDEEEWFNKFQNGTLLVKGWKSRIKDALKPFASPQRDVLHQKLKSLGERIGREWAKDNTIRRIDTKTLQQWGDSLAIKKNGDFDALIAQIEKIESEVDKILS